ncbi:hypothetical protein E0485_23690 [Paenibacillus albiflavus]|uniref:Uncharacterized protein n=1 Tax=Paenibacillus albiflavus TaxID=2545760 RepID=A0A4R4DXP9_9BACL|nr:hypothetical protein [Paenibacillus albiflavus]TCZ69616.1 hypothetical protein E0485_23690 [Paenibacillus albiflavus]
MKQNHKKIGLGSISLLLFIFGILFSISFGNRESFGDNILRFLGLNPWSNGDTGLHYTIFYSLVFYIPALILGYKFKNDLGAKLGKTLSLITNILLSTMILFFIVV